MDFEDHRHVLERVWNRLNAFKLGSPYAHHRTSDEPWRFATEDLEALYDIVTEAEKTVEEAEERADEQNLEMMTLEDKVEEAEAYRDKVCLEAQELRNELQNFEEGEHAPILIDLRAEVQALKGRVTFLQRVITDRDAELGRMRTEYSTRLAKWRKRFAALPETWQERITAEADVI